ncbi:MAG: arylsulfatase [Acidobacteria bacterium]|nr:arylsulfatase [Acidobacteriota bacterium]
MNRRQFLGSATAAAAASAAPATTRPPNIVLIMADDMGIADIGCYGGEIATPNLDALARGGVRFTQFYNGARCCPTRAALMTGLHPHQAGIGHMMEDHKFPAYRGDLNRRCATIAEVLRSGGANYRTAIAGKWHVTPVTDSQHNWPLQRGFDKFFGTIHGAGDFFSPTSLALGNQFVQPDSADFYYTDAIANYAASFIDEFAAASDARPFFCYVPFTSPHWPLHALEADIAKHKGRYAGGWDALRQSRHKRMIELGLIDKRWPLTPRDADVPAWSDARDKEWEQRRMEVYAAQIDRMDQGIGRIVDTLRRRNALDNTLILFLADNGGCAEILGRNSKARHIPLKTRAGEPVLQGNRPELMPGPSKTYQSYGVGWANASNTPFRMYKHWVHEGGISSPLIAHWPKGVKSPGRWVREPGHLIDIMATCVDVSGSRYAGVAGDVQPMEGTSLAPVLRNAKGALGARRDVLCWEHEGNRAVRDGRWKLVSRYNNGSTWELYDLETDRTEMNDLARPNAAQVTALEAKWKAWAARVGVQDWAAVMKS